MEIPAETGTKRRYDFGGEMLEVTGSGQLVPVTKKHKDEVALLSDQQASLTSLVSQSFLH